MANYSYVITDTTTGESSEGKVLNFRGDDVLGKILQQLQQDAGETQLRAILDAYKAAPEDAKIADFVPAECRHLVSDSQAFEAYFNTCVPLEQIVARYRISEVTRGEDCVACFFGWGGQRDHMEHGGCLHEPSTCDVCTQL